MSSAHPQVPLFVYGTLRDPQRVRAVLGRDVPMRPARLPGYGRLAGTGFPYPLAVARSGAHLQGFVLADLSAADFALVDRYEGLSSGLYRRARAAAVLEPEQEAIVVWVYLAGPRFARAAARRRP